MVPDDTSGRPDVVLKKHVLKLGMDGSSLPRLVVITAQNVYICLPSGGITRTVAIARIERVTLCPREDMLNDEHEHDDEEDDEGGRSSSRSTECGGLGRESSAADAGTTANSPPSSPGKQKARGSRSPRSFFSSLFSRGSSAGKSTEKVQASSRRRGRSGKEDVDEIHPASPVEKQEQEGLPRRRQLSSHSSSSASWAAVVTLGIALEAPLALQLAHTDDGMDVVAALRASPNISDKAVFNIPDEEGPTNAAGELLFSTPSRREDPVVPRVLERENAVKEDPQGPVEEVELSPSSPRSTTAASAAVPYPQPSAAEKAVRESSGAGEENVEERPTSGAEEEERDSLRQREALPAASTQLQPRHSSASSSSSSASVASSSKASSVHTAEPVPAVTTRDSEVRAAAAEPAIVLTPGAEVEPLSSNTTAAATAEADGRTPSPLRAAPLREAPQPPLPSLSTTEESPEQPPSSASTRRMLQMNAADDGSGDRKARTAWEMIRDGEARAPQPFADRSQPTSAPSPPPARTLRTPSHVDSSAMTAADVQQPPRYFAAASAPAATDAPTERLQQQQQQQHHRVAAVDVSSPSSAVVRASAAPVETLQAELAQQSETVARLRRSLQAQEALLLELSEVKMEVRSLRATLTERDAQCAEWQAAYTNAESHIGGLRREQQHLLAEQEERLRRAHRAELEAVQAAFEEYDTRMTGFVEQLQRDHREEAAQWQHERRTLHHQLEEMYRLQDGEERARAVAEASARKNQQRRPSPSPPPSGVAASYLDESRGRARGGGAAARQPAGREDSIYERAQGRVQEKLNAHMVQRQHRANTASGNSNVAPASFTATPTPTSPWPQPRVAEPTPTSPPPQSTSRIAFAAHHLFDKVEDVDKSAASFHTSRRDARGGDSLIQTPPSSSTLMERPGDREPLKRGAAAGGYVPHRRSFV